MYLVCSFTYVQFDRMGTREDRGASKELVRPWKHCELCTGAKQADNMESSWEQECCEMAK